MSDHLVSQANTADPPTITAKLLWEGHVQSGGLRIVETSQTPGGAPEGTPPLVMRVVERTTRNDAMGVPIWEVWDGIHPEDVLALVMATPPGKP